MPRRAPTARAPSPGKDTPLDRITAESVGDLATLIPSFGHSLQFLRIKGRTYGGQFRHLRSCVANSGTADVLPGALTVSANDADSMDEPGACEVRAGEEAGDRAQARSSQGAGEEETRHIGLEVVIQHRSTGKQVETAAQGRRDVVEARQVQAKAGSDDDMISALGDHTLGCAQVEPDAVAYSFSSEDVVAEQHRHLSLDSLAKPPCTCWTQEAHAFVGPNLLGQQPEEVRQSVTAPA